MPRQILKYKLHLTGEQFLTLSKDAVLLTVQVQDGELTLWAETQGRVIDTSNSANITIYMVGTGNDMPERVGRYITTVQVETPRGVLVVHIYEGPRE